MSVVGLRVDVDTWRGTRDGVPALVELFARHNIKATFFMSVGPDNMGRHLWRLLKPQFLLKMLRSNAASLYGWDILLAGTAWPGRVIGRGLADVIRLPHTAGHEVGLHTWDHYAWQTHIDRFTPEQMEQQIRLGFEMLTRILGAAPACSAAAGWRCNEQALVLKEKFGFRYNSDCRGAQLFAPMVNGRTLAPQIPVTLPTYDEVIGQGGITNENYNEYILGLILNSSPCRGEDKGGGEVRSIQNYLHPNPPPFKGREKLNVYTIHAEAEGISQRQNFDRFLNQAKARGISFVPLKDLLPDDVSTLPQKPMIKRTMEGREGWVAWEV